MTDPQTDPLVGRTIGSYTILGTLGEGGMGTVYKARDEKLDRMVALKFIRGDLAEGESIQRRFMQEARATSALDHPNIGTIYGIEEFSDGRMCIAMAHYEGESLAKRIRRGPLPPSQAVDIAIQVATGLAEAHAHHIIHRDIKPSNVIVNRGGLVKIVDFGLARIAHSPMSTMTVGTSGTAAYMPPEQATGKSVDNRADLWALGVVLWEMLTGRRPFEAENTPALLLAIVSNPPAALPEEVPAELRPILYRSLAKNPDERYQNAGAMCADLEACRSNQGSAPTQLISARDLKSAMQNASGIAPKRGNRRVWLAAALAIALVSAAAALLIPRLRTPAAPKHIAVLPLENNDPNNQALTDGLEESLTNRLSNLESGSNALWVVPSGELRRRKIAEPADAQRLLGANLVVTGSVRRVDNALQLSLHLIDPTNMRQLNGDVVEDRSGNVGAVQERAVTLLAKWMKLPDVPSSHDAASSARPAAYESYLKARGFMQRYDKPGNIDQAIAQYQEAVKVDPAFALGWAGLADAYISKYKVEQNPHWLDEANDSCSRAVRIGSELAPVHITLGRIQNETGKFDLAVQEFQRALAFEPRNGDALLGLASAYERQGLSSEAAKTYERGVALRPDYWEGYNRLGEFYIRLATGKLQPMRKKKLEDAEAQFRRAVELTPDNWVGYVNLAAALQLQDRYDESARYLEKSIQLSPSYAAYNNLGNIYYRQLKPAQAAPIFEKALAFNDKDFRTWYNYALANRWLAIKGDQAAAAKAETGYKRAQELLLQKAVRDPNDVDAHERLAIIYAFFGNRAEAFRHMETAHALDPKEEAGFVRVQVLELLGDRKGAIAAFELAQKNGLAPDIVKRNPLVQGLLPDPNLKHSR